MKRGIITVSMIVLFCLSAIGTSKATILTFEDTDYQGQFVGDLDIYGGFSWTEHFGVFYGPGLNIPSGFAAGVVSGNYAAFNAYSEDVSVASLVSTGLIDWTGAYFNGPYVDGSLITLKGYSGGMEVDGYSVDIALNHVAPVWFQADWTGIDEISVDSHGNWFTMDDFTYTQGASAPAPDPVPEPTTVALLGIGLVGLAGVDVRRRLKKKVADKS